MIKSMMIMAAAAEQEQANPLIPNIWEIVVTSVGFLVLLFIVVKFVVVVAVRIIIRVVGVQRCDQRIGQLDLFVFSFSS